MTFRVWELAQLIQYFCELGHLNSISRTHINKPRTEACFYKQKTGEVETQESWQITDQPAEPKPAKDNAVKNKVDGFKEQHSVLAPDLYIPKHLHTHMHIIEKHTSKGKELFPCRPALYSSSWARKLTSKLVSWSLFGTPWERELI